MKTRITYSPESELGVLGCFGFLLVMIGAWVTHVLWIIGKLAGDQGATAGQMVLGVIGSIMPPIGVIHGIMLWCS